MSRLTIAAGLSAMLAAGLFFSAPVRAESVMKECGDEWKAAKAANTTNGATWRDFLKECRTRHESAAVAPSAPAPSPTASPTPKPTPTRMSKASPTPAAGEFASEGEAKFRCPTDTVVWVNTKSHKYHFAGNRNYGTTKHGAYMCEGDAKAAGDVAAKGEKPKT